MAMRNVIGNPGRFASSNFSAYQTPSWHSQFVRESEPDYSRDYAVNTDNNLIDACAEFYSAQSKATTMKLQSLWPQFPEGAYLDTTEAAHLYRTTQAISGLVFALNRSTYQRGLANDYSDSIKPLSEAQESKLWSALIALSTDLIKLTDDLQNRSEENSQ